MNCNVCKIEFGDSKNMIAPLLLHVILKHGDDINNRKNFTFPIYESKTSFGDLEDLV